LVLGSAGAGVGADAGTGPLPVAKRLSQAYPTTMLLITKDGKLHCGGRTNDWDLKCGPAGTPSDYKAFRELTNINDKGKKVIAADGSERAIVAILEDGEVWSWGKNTGNGDLGIGSTEELLTHEPQKVALPEGVKGADVSCFNHGCCVKSADKDVYCWGGMFPKDNKPIKIEGMSNTVKMCTGARSLTTLDTSGKVWSFWGDEGIRGSNRAPSEATASLPAGAKAVDIGCAYTQSMLLTDASEVWIWCSGNLYCNEGPATLTGYSREPKKADALDNKGIERLLGTEGYAPYFAFAAKSDGGIVAWGEKQKTPGSPSFTVPAGHKIEEMAYYDEHYVYFLTDADEVYGAGKTFSGGLEKINIAR